MAHRTIIFDLGRVIVPLDFTRSFHELAAIVNCEPEDVPRRIGSSDLVVRFESGEMEPRQFARELMTQLGADLDYEEFCRIWNGIFLPQTLIPEDLLTGLKQRYRLLLLSNTNAIHFPMLRESYPLLGHFDGYVLSYEVGVMKPERRIFEEAIARAGCAAGECFFTDDLAENVEAARSAGMDAAQFVSAEQLMDELRARRIEWT
ncbi:MAG: HAD family phosphatase [Bryobacterales bacterium]|nr:HAD family phosphatase [Bryobacterales bacterium]